MSVAPYPFLPEEPPRYKKYRSRKKRSLRYTKDRHNTNHLSSVEGFSPESNPDSQVNHQQSRESFKRRSRQTISPQLRFMLQLQKVSSVMTFCLVAVTLGIYAWTVYVPRLWSKEYKNLETLQRHERHLTAANETIKHQLAKQAEQAQAGLTNPKPDQAIFLPKTTVAPVANPTTQNSAQSQPFVSTTPVSY